MAKVTKNISNPLVGRVLNPSLGGRAKSPFLTDWMRPSPANSKKGKKRSPKK